MARVNPDTSQLPDDHKTNFDHDRKQSYVRRGGSRGRGRGGRGGDQNDRCCYRCNLPGHFARDCAMPDPRTSTSSNSNYALSWRSNQASVNNSSKVDTIEFASATPKFSELPSKNVDLSPLLANKDKELQLCRQEIESLKTRLNKATTELDSVQDKNKNMVLNMNKLQEDLEKCREELSCESKKTEEMRLKWFYLEDEFADAKAKWIERLAEVDEAYMTAVSDKMELALEMDQWRKSAKAVASVFVGGADVCSKTPEFEPLVLIYSNRAAKRMSLGKIRKAIDDCRIATRLDPEFPKVYLTAGNCHLVLGETDDALKSYKQYLDSGVVFLDRRLTIEASDGLQNAEKVVSYINRSAELLKDKTIDSATNALEVITEALSISCYSEKLLEMKGEALFMLHKYEKVVEMCEQTLVFAENNYNHMSDEDQKQQLKLWRWSLMSRSYFCMAKFDLALSILEKYEQLAPLETKNEGPSSLSAASLRELLRCKNAGNEAYKGGKYREAVEHYSNSIRRSIESRPFTAICLCNRAAAYQALGEVMDAIADCNLAIALDGDYMKAISRRANLHEKIRDYVHAALDFQRLISLLEKQSEKKHVEDLTVARRRLSSVNRNMKQGLTLDLYLILGLKGSESGAEIKKAYHKAALKHHPDKAGKFLVRNEGSRADGVVWKEIFTTIHEDADKLFKIIGEAYAVLSDPNKRFKYNLEDAMKDDCAW
uniref:dnaJ homolog subfamily C member 7 homolog n=1 Tax=Erigeron canadensis TaxID=72917 RepID=UPI001CB8BB0B|nr:dnaJ homolog subfamily C member 7 homolog [Erigeron canadensis]